MNTSNWTRVKQIFQEAIELPPADRGAFLDKACEENGELRAEVETLLSAHEGGEDLHFPTTLSVPRDRVPVEGPGTMIGRYKLLQQIGEGGFGLVYMAEQEKPVRRKVALKIIKLGMDTRQIIARFEAERQALALMDHPNIARVLDAGATETGRPYFVMELVRGIPITEYCDQNNLTTHERLQLFQSVCAAVQHAHQKGIIHRDIKPSNVMVTLHDGVPVPKVIDFGIAKATNQRLTEKTLFTAYHQFVGTPQYMSPEQAEMSGLDIDTRTDIYALGVLLYELLTGTTPFDANRLRGLAYSEIHRVIREEDPEKPSTRVSTLGQVATATAKSRKTDVGTLRRDLSGDLDWIVMRAIEKDRTRRYDTANSLRLDIERHLRNEPVLASPPGAAYRIRKFVRRNRTAVLVFGAVTAALVAGIGLATFGFLQANRERVVARQEAEAATAINDFFTEMLASLNPKPYASRLSSPTLGAEVESRPRKEVSVKEMLLRATSRIGESFEGRPLLEAQARETIGKTLLGLQSESEALQQFNKALEIRRQELGEADREVLRSRLLTVGALADLRQAHEAAKLAGETLSDLERCLGEEDPLTLLGAGLYASTLMQSGDFSAVDSIYRVTLERQRRVLGPNHRDTIGTMLAWTDRYCWAGNGSRAVELSAEAARRARAAYGEDDPLTIQADERHAFSLNFMGRHAEAKAIIKPALERAKRIIGEDKETIDMLWFGLARALSTDFEGEEKEALYRQFHKSSKRDGTLGQKWVGFDDYTWILVHRGKIEEAVEVAREVYDYWSDVEQEVDRSLSESRIEFIQNLVTDRYRRLLAVAEEWDKIRALESEQIARLRERAMGDSAAALDWNDYAWRLLTSVSQELRDPEEALSWATRAVDAGEDLDLPDRATNLDTKALALALTGDLEAALRVESRAVALCNQSDTELTDQATRSLLPELIRYATMLDRADVAEETTDRVLDAVLTRHGAGTQETAESLRKIGDSVQSRGLYHWARPLLQRSLAEARRQPDEKTLLESLISLARIQAGEGDPAAAEPLIEEAAALYRKMYVGDPVDWSPGLGFTDEGERSLESVHFKGLLAFRLLDISRIDEAEELLHQIECVRGMRFYAPLKARYLLARGDSEAALPYFRTAYMNSWASDARLRSPGTFALREGDYGHCLALAGRLDEAEAVLLRAYDRAMDWCGSASTRTSRIAGWIAELYEARSNPVEASRWRDRVEQAS